MATRGDSTGSGQIFLVIKHHTICEESKVEKEGFKKVEVFNPKTKETLDKWIDPWGSVSGYVNGIEYYDSGDTYETRFKSLKINIDDEVILTLPEKTPSYDTFCKFAENIDFTKEVKFFAKPDKKGERTAFFASQDGEGVKWKYTKDNPGDCPPWEKDEDGEWDSRKQRAFLKQRMVEVVIPAVEAAAAERAGEAGDAPDGNPAAIIEAGQTKAKAATATAGKKSKKEDVEVPATTTSDDDIPF